MAMKEKRIQEIKKYIDMYEFVSLEDLCEKFSISKNTLRRDINELETQGVIQKIYGGVATLNQKMTSFETRTSKFNNEKDRITKFAASLIEPEQLIFIDAGTTTYHIIKYLPTDFHYTVLTNGLDIINGVASLNNISLITIGNFFKRETRAFLNNETENTILDRYNIHRAFMAATGISIENGLTNYDIQEYGIKKHIVQKSKQVFLLADESKFGRDSLLTYANVTDLTGIITSSKPSNEYLSFCKENNVQLHIV